VFSEFLFGGRQFLPRPAGTDAPLVFTLNGLSKMFALPGMKIGWMAVSGREDLVGKAMSTLEMMSDTFLPVNELAQFAVPRIFQHGRPFVLNYAAWVKERREEAVSALNNCLFTPPEGGFYATLPVEGDEDEVATMLLQEEGILVHPGYFYDIDGHHIVMTFIHEPAVVRQCFSKIARFCRKVHPTP
jgi:aspartate/methionine/tyrosine aminotransferase